MKGDLRLRSEVVGWLNRQGLQTAESDKGDNGGSEGAGHSFFLIDVYTHGAGQRYRGFHLDGQLAAISFSMRAAFEPELGKGFGYDCLQVGDFLGIDAVVD